MGGKITALEMQKHNKERVSVYIDGEFAFGLNMSDAVQLSKGQVLSDQDIARLQSSDEVARSFEYAVRYLGYRPRSTQEVRLKLRRRDISPEAVEQIIERLTELKYLDDLEFARFWVRNREEFRPRGPAALRAELRQKGISNDIINEVLSNFEAEDSAWRAARKKARSMRKLDEQTFRRRLTGFLARRGFSYGTARPIVDQLIEERESDAGDEENSHYGSDPIEE